MTSAALPALPAVIAAGPGAVLAASIAGAVIDSFLLPALFSKGQRDGPRLGDIQIADSSEGAPLWRLYGEKVRIPALLTWSDGVREVQDRSKGGGKGGSGSSFLQFKPFSSAQFTVADHEIEAIEKIYADGKLFWSEKDPVNFVTSTYTASIDSSQLFGGPVTNYLVITYDANAAGAPTTIHELDSGSDVTVSGFDQNNSTLFTTAPPAAKVDSSGGANLIGASFLKVEVLSATSVAVDDTINISGHPTRYRVKTAKSVGAPGLMSIEIDPVLQSSLPSFAATSATQGNVEFRTAEENNDGVWEVVSTSFDKETNVSVVKMQSRDLPGYPFTAYGGGRVIRIQQKSISSTVKYGRVALQLGSEDQEADPLIVTRLSASVGGADQVIASKGSAGFVIESMDLTDFGNRLGNFEALVRPRPGGDVSVAAAILSLSELCGVPSSRVDVSQASGTLRGLPVRGPQDPGTTLQLLLLAFDIVPREHEDKIIFCDRELIPVVDVDLRDLGVLEPNGTTPYPFEIEQVDDRRLPSKIVVNFTDPARGYQSGTVDSVFDRPLAPNIVEIRTGLVMTRDEAQHLADRSRDLAHSTNFRYKGTLAPSYLSRLQEGLIMRVPATLGRTHDILITKLDVGVNGILEWEGRGEDPEALIQTVSAGIQLAATISPDFVANGSPSIAWHAMDIPPLSDTDRRQPGYYVAAASADPSRTSGGFVLLTSTDGVSYGRTADIPSSAIMGRATTAPSSAGIAFEWLDRSTVVRVELLDSTQTLESVSELEMLRGNNRFLWGDEIIGAATCTFVSAGVYDLSILKRGIGDTDDELTNHAIGDRVVWLNGGGVVFVPINHAALGGTRKIKVVGAGGLADQATAHDVTIEGRSVKPHRVAQVCATRDASNNLTVTWNRKTRAIVADYDQGDPLDDDLDTFLIEVLDSGSVIRTEDGATSSSWVYSAANQTTDGLTPGDPVDIRISQKSIAFHTGRAREVTV